MMSRWLIFAALAVAMAPPSMAQNRGAGFGPGAGFGRGVGFTGRHHRGFGGGSFYLGDPFFYSDYPSGSLASQAFSPPMVIVQAPPTAVVAEPKSEPLLIEWQGDRYVRFSGDEDAKSRAAPDYVQPAAVRPTPGKTATSSAGSAPLSAELPPAVLIFRDGHREEVSDYVIARGVLYARGDYWQNGYWTKNIQLAVLDIPATLAANLQNGAKFVLPSGPNEVVTRP